MESVKIQYINSFENALLFRYIYKGKLVKMSENTAFLFYKEIYMKYLILYYNWDYGNKYRSSKESSNLYQIIIALWKKNLSSDGQQFHQC